MKTSRYLTATMALIFCSNLQATDYFAAGLDAFQSRNYEQALQHFSAAQAAGRQDDELLYNKAICYYRLDQWSEANTLLRGLYSRHPEQELIAYNLAVTEKKLGNREQATGLFLEVALSSATPELAAFADRQYQLLARADAPTESPRGGGSWLVSADVSFGTDDNVIDPSDLAGSEEDDSFTETMLTARWFSDANLRKGWVVDGYAYLSRYDEVDEYDIDMGDLGFRRYAPTDFGFWYLGGHANTSQLGGEAYLRSLSFSLGSGGQLANGQYWNAHYRFRELDSLGEDYDPLAGSNQRINLDYGGTAGAQSRWRVEYRFELDDRADAEYELAFTSYSAARHTLGASWAVTSGELRASLRADYRYSDYLDDNLFSDGTNVGRQDDRYKLTLRGSWYLTPNWALTAEYSFTDNRSNIDTYDYDRQVIMLGIGWQL